MNFTPSTVHPCENDIRLPENIRGGHYIHFRHFCAVLGCEHAPYCKIREQFAKIGELILHKDTDTQLLVIIKENSLFSKRKYNTINVPIKNLLDIYNEDKTMLLYGNSVNSGYPITEILQAVAYIIADDNELSGKRPKGYIKVIENHIQKNANLTVELKKPDLLTPLVIIGNGRGAMIGAENPDVYTRY